LYAYWRDGQLFFHNFAKRETISGRPLTCEVLNFFGCWRTPQDAIAHFANYSPGSVRSALSQLVKRGLLVTKDSPEVGEDNRIARAWKTWLPEGSFHFSTKDAPYADSRRRFAQWKSALPKTPPPKLFKIVKGAKKTLPPRTLPDSEFIRVLMGRKTHREFSNQELTLENLSQLLSLVWGVTGYLHPALFGKLLHKTSPSGGARHPGEVYVMALRVRGLKPGLYYYHPANHYLKMINPNATPKKASLYCARQDHPRNAAALFIMTAVFGRTMWKYFHPRAYRVVLLDAGHLCQTFCLVATWLGLAPFCTAALADTLIESDLRIDGVRESVLYIAGVGLPATTPRLSSRLRARTTYSRSGRRDPTIFPLAEFL
jgi:SagB-type dehydrogenase family enzyme